MDTVEVNETIGFPAELRNYILVKDILNDLCINRLKLRTNNPDKVHKITDFGIIVEEIKLFEFPANSYDEKYSQTKNKKMGHKLSLV